MSADPELDKRMRLAYWRLLNTTLRLNPSMERLKLLFDALRHELQTLEDDNKGDTSA